MILYFCIYKAAISSSVIGCINGTDVGPVLPSTDDLRTIFKWEPRGPSGMKNATNRAITTKNEPNTNGGPGRDCN